MTRHQLYLPITQNGRQNETLCGGSQQGSMEFSGGPDTPLAPKLPLSVDVNVGSVSFLKNFEIFKSWCQEIGPIFSQHAFSRFFQLL